MVEPAEGGGGYSPMDIARDVVARRPILVPLTVTVLAVIVWVGWTAATGDGDEPRPEVSADDTTGVPGDAASTDAAAPTTSTEAPLPPFDGWVNPASFGRMWSDEVPGLLTFRGNPTRSYYGDGPVPEDPTVLWSYPGDGGGLCGTSIDGSGAQTWCGTGWTGQPAVWESERGTTVTFGAYDYGVHWLDAATGDTVLPSFPTGDIIKGSVTIDPDGYPITYTGSRDDHYRAIATDRDEPVELWRFNAEQVAPTLWNDDWDGSGLVIDDYLFEGGENSQFHIWKLNRGYDADGLVTVDPELVFNTPGWDQELLSAIGDEQVSIENSVAISGNTVYFSNGGGRVQGWDITGLKDGVTPTRTFRFWTGDDTDASIVIDEEGMLYVSSEFEPSKRSGAARARATEIGQIIKLDPTRPDDPVVWSVKDQTGGDSGAWGTSAVTEDMVYSDFNSGRVVGIDRTTGDIVWEKKLTGPTWQSPVVVDDTLILGDCDGELHAYDVSDPTVDPPEKWSVQLSGCIESTPAVWGGRIFVGARGGRFYAIGDPDLAPPGGPEGDPTWTGPTAGSAGATSAGDGSGGGSTVTTQRPTVTTAGDG